MNAISSMGEQGEAAIPVLVEGLENHLVDEMDETDRRTRPELFNAMAQALQQMGPKTISYLPRLVKVEEATSTASSKEQVQKVIDLLVTRNGAGPWVEALKDPNPYVKKETIRSLQEYQKTLE